MCLGPRCYMVGRGERGGQRVVISHITGSPGVVTRGNVKLLSHSAVKCVFCNGDILLLLEQCL